MSPDPGWQATGFGVVDVQGLRFIFASGFTLATYLTSTRPRKSSLLAFLLLAFIAPSLCAQSPDGPALTQLLRLAGTHPGGTGPDPARLGASPTNGQRLPLFEAVMAQPLEAPSRAANLAQSFAAAAASPFALMGITGDLAGLTPGRSTQSAAIPTEGASRPASDPLAASLAWMAPMAAQGTDWPPSLPDLANLPNPLRHELALVLSAMSRSHRILERSFDRIPKTVTPDLLRRQAFDGEFMSAEEPDYRELLGLVDGGALLAGMLHLVAAVERLRNFVATTPNLLRVVWTLDTPMGKILVDTTGRDNRHELKDTLLVVDVGGDDRYEFAVRSDGLPISVLLDHGGNDRFEAGAPGGDPSSATLGYGILWDTGGDDTYLGTQQAQASALFGAALLVDGGGDNQFVAASHSQAHAIGGLAVLLSGAGDDRFTAQTHAQDSAGPQGVAVLMDPAGNDRYALDNTPLIRPSPQLPDRNTSMGQGAARGIRDFSDGRSSAGGVGMLIDLQGNDRYAAQVFAQGAGYYEGLGMLVDFGGSDQFDAAWYAMGAAAHRGAGILLKRGMGSDSYRASHSLSLGAAHDFSAGIFLDEGGNDHYELGDLGLGAAHDHGVALFVDAGGIDTYQVAARACRALGAAHISDSDTSRADLLNLGLFMDLGGTDSYADHCGHAGNNSAWRSPHARPDLSPRSQAGAGIDGQWPVPAARPLFTHSAPGNSQ